MVGGDEQAIERVRPILETMGKSIVHQGGPGAGQHTKMVNQILIATGMIGVCEALLYGYKAGLDLDTVLESVAGGAAGSWSLTNYGPRMLAGDFAPGFVVDHFVKDMGIALGEAKKAKLCATGPRARGAALRRAPGAGPRSQGHALAHPRPRLAVGYRLGAALGALGIAAADLLAHVTALHGAAAAAARVREEVCLDQQRAQQDDPDHCPGHEERGRRRHRRHIRSIGRTQGGVEARRRGAGGPSLEWLT